MGWSDFLQFNEDYPDCHVDCPVVVDHTIPQYEDVMEVTVKCLHKIYIFTKSMCFITKCW